MKYNFNYLIDKIAASEFDGIPFKHIYIENFFSDEHFEEIKNSEEIASPNAINDKELIRGLQDKGFKVIGFPGCITNIKKYIKWHSEKKNVQHNSSCEGFGMVLRLYKFESPILSALNAFLIGDEFNKAIADKFGITFANCSIDGGIQKYLDGYEISPHPDIRKKAATFMVNINPSDQSESLNHHTHYLKLKPIRKYVQTFWDGNQNVDRTWLPWSWADTVKQQKKNNSIVLFSPLNDTLHGVKADYNHLITQRTQLYGNLWYLENPADKSLKWESLDLQGLVPTTKLKHKAIKLIPSSVKTNLKKLLRLNERGSRNI